MPAFLLLLLTNLLPLIVPSSISASPTTSSARSTPHFVGLANFHKALADPVFRRSLANTFLYVAIVLPGRSVLGLLDRRAGARAQAHAQRSTRSSISCRSPRR